MNARSTLLLCCLLLSSACSADPLRLATTSTYNSGLLDYLLPDFERSQNIPIQVIAVGTGKALRLGQSGDVDLVLVHAPQAEQQFVDQGYGVDRTGIMYNDFIIVGPEQDPAGIKNLASATKALDRIAAKQALFVSLATTRGRIKKN